jgi:hypothetical protein
MLRENLKKELDALNDEQLQKVADFIASAEFQTRHDLPSVPFWQRATPAERAKEFREWVLPLSKGTHSLQDTAFSRDSIYE